LDAKSEMTLQDICNILERAHVDESDYNHVLEFLFYYGVIGLRVDGADQYIYNVHYDTKVLPIRAEITGERARYIVNPAFWLALGIQ